MKQIYLLLVAVLIIQTAQSQIVNIPDANFKNALLNHPYGSVDGNGDGEIQVSEAESVSFLVLNDNNISSLEGIQSFINLAALSCNNNQLSYVDLSSLNDLGELYLENNLFASFDDILLPTNPSYGYSLSVAGNQLSEININNLPSNLNYLDCSNNQLTSLDVSQFNLYEFYCNDNPLTSLTLSPYTAYLNVSNTNLTEIDLSDLQLDHLSCNDNPNLISIKLGQGSEYGFYIQNNPVLETINFKNGVSNMTDGSSFGGPCYICNNPNLKFVCADEFEIENSSYTVDEGGNIVTVTVDGVQQFVDNCGYTNVVVSPYCTFEPGGNLNTVQGTNAVDANDNGCDAGDSSMPYLKYNINSDSFISDDNGDYIFYVGDYGTHTISPDLENPEYYTVSPESFSVDFQTDTSPFTQDFCITPNGTYNDLEVTLIPVELARPGFDTDYKVVYKNKGTTTLSGMVDLSFQDDVMDLVSTNPVADSQSTGILSWIYSNLLPFESREILVTMNLNTPTDTPALNGDDILAFTAIINPATGDETIEDNTFELSQLVVNSFDPNDKTCLEGNTITPDLIGEYVNYLIRFENTGTANAINIVVKDMIDTAKFDVSTLFLTDSSHDLVTRIAGNKVEFIFENINLPFDDANNDGYIAFKIKTLATLVEGDTFENDAQIFFDYNFPIQTNVAQTSIQSPLSTVDFESSGFEIYPNPSQDKLFINGLDAIKSVSIYDISGRLVNEVALIGTRNNIEISTEKLGQGAYFVKVKTDAGEFAKKMVKN